MSWSTVRRGFASSLIKPRIGPHTLAASDDDELNDRPQGLDVLVISPRNRIKVALDVLVAASIR